MSKSLKNNLALMLLAKYGCKCVDLYASSVFVIAFPFLSICFSDMLRDVNEWNKRELEARNLNESNTKHGGRGRFDMAIILACCFLRIIFSLSELQLIQRLYNDNFVRAALCSLLDRQITDDELPSYSTLQKYQSQWAHDQVIAKALEKFNQNACLYAQARTPSEARNKAIDYLPLSDEQKAQLKEFGYCAITDATFLPVEINHLSKFHFNALKEGRESDVAGLLTFMSESHKRMELDFGYKYGKYYFGVKLHIIIEATTGLIIGYEITPASTHDLTQLLSLENQSKQMCPNLSYCLGDSIYNSKDIKDTSAKQYGIKVLAVKKPTRKPLTIEQITNNQAIGKLRCFVEHPFSFLKHTLKLKLTGVETPRLHMDCQFAIAIHNAYRLAKVL